MDQGKAFLGIWGKVFGIAEQLYLVPFIKILLGSQRLLADSITYRKWLLGARTFKKPWVTNDILSTPIREILVQEYNSYLEYNIISKVLDN